MSRVFSATVRCVAAVSMETRSAQTLGVPTTSVIEAGMELRTVRHVRQSISAVFCK